MTGQKNVCVVVGDGDDGARLTRERSLRHLRIVLARLYPGRWRELWQGGVKMLVKGVQKWLNDDVVSQLLESLELSLEKEYMAWWNQFLHNLEK